MSQSLELPAKLIDIHNHLAEDDPDGSRLLRMMDERDIETTLIMASEYDHNAVVARAVQAHPGRFAGGVYVEPPDGDLAIDQIVRYRDAGLCMVKLLPNRGYYPDDEAFLPLFAKTDALGMGVLGHCGWLIPTKGVTAAYYSHPGRFEKVARTFPDMPMIMAHMGGIAGFLETIMLTTRTPNVYTDCSPGQGVWVLECASAMAASIPADKLMWGADCYYDPVFFDRQRDGLARCGFAAEAEKIYRENALKLLRKTGGLPADREQTT